MSGMAQAGMLPDGRRLHLNHGPIDLVIEAWGGEREVALAYAQAAARFETVLTELVGELSALRQPAAPDASRRFAGVIANHMERAVLPFAAQFITPMAAVAGSVAQEVLDALGEGRRLEKAYVNNGGDIALQLAPGTSIRLAIAGAGHGFGDRIAIDAESPVRGVATSGWRGRSFSLGIADAVTVLARSAAQADAAATIIANAVDLPGNAQVQRRPARDLACDSDLGDMSVTVGVGALARHEIVQALDAGQVVAEACRRRGLIEAAALFLGGDMRLCGDAGLDTSARNEFQFAALKRPAIDNALLLGGMR